MPRARDLLDRFRPAAAPGPAGAAPVPGDRRAAAERELASIFANLTEVEQACGEIRRIADAAAQQRAEHAAEQAAGLVAEARRDAPAERSAAEARRYAVERAGLAQIRADAEAEALQVRRRATQRLPELVDLAVADVRAQIAALAGEGGPPSGSPR